MFNVSPNISVNSLITHARANLERETKLVGLLDSDQTIGVHLTTGLLEPEQSSSAIVVHPPAEKYS